MARVTVEDCIEVIPNRFELVAISAQRAKQIASGAPLTLDRDNDKDAVVALREVAERTVDLAALEEEAISSYSTYKMSESHTLGDDEAEPQDVEDEEIANAFANEQVDVTGTSEHEAKHAMSFMDMDEDIDD